MSFIILLPRINQAFYSNDDEDSIEVNINDKSLAQRIRLVDTLEEDDRRAIMQIIDSMLAKKKIRDFLNQPKNEATTKQRNC